MPDEVSTGYEIRIQDIPEHILDPTIKQVGGTIVNTTQGLSGGWVLLIRSDNDPDEIFGPFPDRARAMTKARSIYEQFWTEPECLHDNYDDEDWECEEYNHSYPWPYDAELHEMNDMLFREHDIYLYVMELQR